MRFLLIWAAGRQFWYQTYASTWWRGLNRRAAI